MINKQIIKMTFIFSSFLLAPTVWGENEISTPVPELTSFVTEHRARFNGQLINYTATAGETYVRDENGVPKASIFTFAYTKKNLSENEVRPVTFLWNGGPGSASIWLHMGLSLIHI